MTLGPGKVKSHLQNPLLLDFESPRRGESAYRQSFEGRNCLPGSCCWRPGAWAEMSICAFPLQFLGASQKEALQPLVRNSQGTE